MSEMGILKKQNSESGQAVVEYILLVAISVALILGLMKQLYAPFGNWMQDYMGQYLECLLDVGELPSLGGGSSSGECNSRFAAFSITGGRPPDPNTGGKNNRENKLQGKDTHKNGDKDSFSSGAGSADDNNNSVAARARSSGRNDSFNVGTPIGADSDRSNAGDESGQMMSKLPATNYMRLRRGSNSVVVNQEPETRRGVNQSFFVNFKKKKEIEAPVAGTTTLEEEVSPTGKAKKLIVKAPERKVAAAEANESWNFSDYFMYGLIILIVVAVLLFLFGQMAQISKSMEKN